MEIVVVDAFTDRPFAGNPAAVCRLSGPVDEAWMKNLAREMNLSETAFLIPQADGHQIRWLTPSVEVDLCGHATLASAHVLMSEGAELVRFSSRSGPLSAARLADGWIRLDFPATPPTVCEPPVGLLEALGCQARWVGRSRFDYLVEVESEGVVRALTPDHSALGKLDVRGIMVTAPGQDYDFVSRFFAPGAGVTKDPVTGSAHCCLTPYWAGKLGKPRLLAYQASARGGVVRVELAGQRVYLEGQAVTVSRVRLEPPAEP
ncbi:MAG: PhzF family phenazine biosynthesis protein [Candidatus Eremiobacteraeota bacterium]|nr:PhzF family phenazine biosynthesis protein [Candidatus Eremiobacteraeota bacterium]